MTKRNLSQSMIIAFEGIAHALSNERNIRIQALIGVIVLAVSLILRIPKNNVVIILVVSFLVIITELINTSFEKFIDSIHPAHNEEIGKAKDMLAGAVLLSVILAIIVGLLILWEPLIEFLRAI
jgi:diacylglycerol kinase